METQVISRAHRMGATGPTLVTKLVADDTVEEYLMSFSESYASCDIRSHGNSSSKGSSSSSKIKGSSSSSSSSCNGSGSSCTKKNAEDVKVSGTPADSVVGDEKVAKIRRVLVAVATDPRTGSYVHTPPGMP